MVTSVGFNSGELGCKGIHLTVVDPAGARPTGRQLTRAGFHVCLPKPEVHGARKDSGNRKRLYSRESCRLGARAAVRGPTDRGTVMTGARTEEELTPVEQTDLIRFRRGPLDNPEFEQTRTAV